MIRHIPRSLDGIEEYEMLIDAAMEFETQLHSLNWSTENSLHEWCSKAGEHWGKARKVDMLNRVRVVIRGGIKPDTSVTATLGAPRYEGVNSRASLFDWTWEEDWMSPSRTTSSSRRRQRHSASDQPQVYECTAMSAPLLTLLGEILQEYTHLSSFPTIASAYVQYPEIAQAMFSLFRAGAVLYASSEPDSPLRLVNDCNYLSGEVGLMSFGIGHMGFYDLNAALGEISRHMDLCAVYWKERYLVDLSFNRDNGRRICVPS